jgi:hypothetical protein
MGRPNLFGADIAGAIFAALGSQVLDATLTRTTAGTRTPGSLTAGQTSGEAETSYPCKGFIDSWSDFRLGATAERYGGRSGTLVEDSDRKIILLGKSLPDDIDPRPGDMITIEDRVYTIVGPVERDPAGATFTCRGQP